jgi:hypothetical protein
MGAFWADAANIFETARQASQSGSTDCDWAILIGPQGDIRMMDGAGWSLPGLLAHHGAETAYRVTRERGRVCLEGRQGSQTCLLRSEPPAVAARHLLSHHLPPTEWNPAHPALLAASHPQAKEIWKMFA